MPKSAKKSKKDNKQSIFVDPKEKTKGISAKDFPPELGLNAVSDRVLRSTTKRINDAALDYINSHPRREFTPANNRRVPSDWPPLSSPRPNDAEQAVVTAAPAAPAAPPRPTGAELAVRRMKARLDRLATDADINIDIKPDVSWLKDEPLDVEATDPEVDGGPTVVTAATAATAAAAPAAPTAAPAAAAPAAPAAVPAAAAPAAPAAVPAAAAPAAPAAAAAVPVVAAPAAAVIHRAAVNAANVNAVLQHTTAVLATPDVAAAKAQTAAVKALHAASKANGRHNVGGNPTGVAIFQPPAVNDPTNAASKANGAAVVANNLAPAITVSAGTTKNAATGDNGSRKSASGTNLFAASTRAAPVAVPAAGNNAAAADAAPALPAPSVVMERVTNENMAAIPVTVVPTAALDRAWDVVVLSNVQAAEIAQLKKERLKQLEQVPIGERLQLGLEVVLGPAAPAAPAPAGRKRSAVANASSGLPIKRDRN